MPAAYLHGIETFTTLKGPRPVQAVKSSTMFIVGTAPIHHATGADAPNTPSLVLSDQQLPEYGPDDLAGYTIPAALKAITDVGAGTIFVVNVFDPATHKTIVAAAAKNIVDKKVALGVTDLISVTVTKADDSPCVAGTDYTVDRVTGVITILSGGNLAAAATCKVGYTRANPAAVDDDDIIGEMTEGGVRTGAQAALSCASEFGYGPKLLLAPGFSQLATVRAALLTLKAKLRAYVLADLPVGTTSEQAIESRGEDGDVDATAADRSLVYCYPHVKVGTALQPYSTYLAALIAKTDLDLGYWYSPSNKDLPAAVTGMELPLTADFADANCEVNQLNAAGIVTIFSAYGEGRKAWGNRASSFPGATDILSFIACGRTVDMVEEELQRLSKVFVDRPITDALITDVLADINAYMRTQIGRGALLPGSRVEFFADRNPSDQLSAGQVRFTRTYCPPPPAERITFDDIIDTTLLKLGS